MEIFQFLQSTWHNFNFLFCIETIFCEQSFPAHWYLFPSVQTAYSAFLNVDAFSMLAKTPLVSTPTYMSTPCRDDSEGDQAIIISHHHWFHEATIYQTISGRGNGAGGWVRVEVGEDWEMGVSVSGRTSHRILSPFPQTHKAICRC